jgi:predicted Ser/Thr protein kinase
VTDRQRPRENGKADAPKRKPRRASLEKVLEQTASARDFTASAVNRVLEDTASDDGSPGSPGIYLRRTAAEATGPESLAATSDITHFVETSQVPLDLVAGETQGAKRFELHEEVGRGATGRVYALRDNSLDRTVAVKFLRHGREAAKRSFLHEARVTATLEHPNIMPVYDIGATDDGRLFFTMKKIAGTTLGDAIRAARDGKETPEEFGSVDGLVRIFLKVCDALTYAHDRGFVHQDVKPDNIMLGEYGEVLLLDWGSAVRVAETVSGERRLYGTPAYMSPEQARRERADERSDVYCLGATLFHALVRRHPTWAEDAEQFWTKKRRGVVDPLSQGERHRAPKVLLDIALKALEADPARRYQMVGALTDDLKRYQAGMAVSAHRETLLETLRRWYRRNRRLFWSAAVPTAAVLAVAGLFMREKIQELVTWRPFFHETFSYRTAEELGAYWTGLSSPNWTMVNAEPFTDSGSWRVQDSVLHGFSGEGYRNITFRRRIPGDIRVEWDITPQRINRRRDAHQRVYVPCRRIQRPTHLRSHKRRGRPAARPGGAWRGAAGGPEVPHADGKGGRERQAVHGWPAYHRLPRP